jgi:DNA-binding transcriptional LysR family regulator
VVREFQRQGVPLNMPIEMPTVETIRRLVQAELGVAFLPMMCVQPDLEAGTLVSVKVKEMQIERKIYLLRPSRRALSYAAGAFLDLLG